jgi:hypothetical protein
MRMQWLPSPRAAREGDRLHAALSAVKVFIARLPNEATAEGSTGSWVVLTDALTLNAFDREAQHPTLGTGRAPCSPGLNTSEAGELVSLGVL